MYTPRNPNVPLTFEEKLEREVERRWQLQIADEIDLARRTIRRLKTIGLYAKTIDLDNTLWALWFRDDERVRLALAVFEAAARLSWSVLLDAPVHYPVEREELERPDTLTPEHFIEDDYPDYYAADGVDTYCDNCGGNLDDGGIHWFQTAPDTWICQPNVAEARADATEDDWKVR